jgi:hypothetical protein
MIDKVSDVARPVVDHIASGAHHAVDKIAGVAGQAAETLGVKGEQLKNAQVRAMKQCRGYIRDNPVTAPVGAWSLGGAHKRGIDIEGDAPRNSGASVLR